MGRQDPRGALSLLFSFFHSPPPQPISGAVCFSAGLTEERFRLGKACLLSQLCYLHPASSISSHTSPILLPSRKALCPAQSSLWLLTPRPVPPQSPCVLQKQPPFWLRLLGEPEPCLQLSLCLPKRKPAQRACLLAALSSCLRLRGI